MMTPIEAKALQASGLIEMLAKGEWWQTVVQGPNPTSFSSDQTIAVHEAATALQSALQTVIDMGGEVLRLVDALEYAHSNGFEWPVDPLPFGSIAHDLFIERGNDPDRIEARATLTGEGQ